MKLNLIKTILTEIVRAQDEPWVPPPAGKVAKLKFPPNLPLGDGRQLHVTEELLQAISNYARLCRDNNPSWKTRFKIDELEKIYREAFAQILVQIDIDQIDEALESQTAKNVDRLVEDRISNHDQKIEMALGCHLLKGDAAYPIRVGPVLFETRERWLQRVIEEKKISLVTARRIEAFWSGKKLRKRKPALASAFEDSILETIGDCPVVCTVSTDGLSFKMLTEKGLLNARLAMTAISLMWEKPSQGLSWMNLLYDGQAFNRHFTLFRESGVAGSSGSVSQMPTGRWTDEDLISELRAYQDLFDQVGEALGRVDKRLEP